MNPDFAIVLNFKLANSQNADPDALVKKARDVGARAISGGDIFKAACEKYTIFLSNETDGSDLSTNDVIQTMVENRKNDKATVINVPVNADGQLTEQTSTMLETINNWMHMFGHAFNEGKPSELSIDQDGFVLENRHADYQKYVFLKNPLPNQVIVSGLKQEPNRVEWIENRVDLDFTFNDGKLAITLTEPNDTFPWQVLRIQAHRPEDDLAETKF